MPRPNMVQNEHPLDVRFAPTEAERRHKSGASASRYANIGQNYGSAKHGTIRMVSQKTLAFLFTSAIIRCMEA